MKDVVHETPVRDLLKLRIAGPAENGRALEHITEDMLDRTRAQLEYCLDILHTTDVAHIELC